MLQNKTDKATKKCGSLLLHSNLVDIGGACLKAVLMLLRAFNWSIQPPPLLPLLFTTAVTVLQTAGEKYLSDSIPADLACPFKSGQKRSEYGLGL